VSVFFRFDCAAAVGVFVTLSVQLGAVPMHPWIAHEEPILTLFCGVFGGLVPYDARGPGVSGFHFPGYDEYERPDLQPRDNGGRRPLGGEIYSQGMMMSTCIPRRDDKCAAKPIPEFPGLTKQILGHAADYEGKEW
jgi:hypothetical protein